ncbi:MAG: metallophosphoesterase, partial [Armatimonadota bacterium]|nr:metallophosphoesterase [Armatimonadota bacterium]
MKSLLSPRLVVASLLLAASPGTAHDEDTPHDHPTTASAVSGTPRVVVQIEPGPNPWTHLNLHNNPRHFQFAIVTDRTGGHRPGIFEDAVRKLNLLRPEFVMSVGDLIEGYTTNEAEIDRQWKEFMSFTAQLKMPFFYVPGNHDISNPVMAKEWQKRFGRSYYHFVYQDVLFLCVNSEDQRPANISDEQIKYMAAALEANENVRWTLVFFHQPLWTYIERAEAARATNPKAPPPPQNGWRKMEALLQDRPYTVFVGHNHNYLKFERNDRRYIILATTGGATALRGPVFGEFDHVAWVTMTDDGPL